MLFGTYRPSSVEIADRILRRQALATRTGAGNEVQQDTGGQGAEDVEGTPALDDVEEVVVN